MRTHTQSFHQTLSLTLRHNSMLVMFISCSRLENTIYDNKQPACNILFCNMKLAMCLKLSTTTLWTEVWLHTISSLALDGGGWSSSINWLLCLCRKSPWNALATWQVSPTDVMLWRREKSLGPCGQSAPVLLSSRPQPRYQHI
jgi:hypothetical protein